MSVQWPRVTVGIITYNRPDEIARTLTALLEHVRYPALQWVIADDSSPGNYRKKLEKLEAVKASKARIISTPKNSGWGANANHLLNAVETDYLFMIEDDYVLTQPLDLTVGVALMEAKPDIGFVRYRGTAGEHMVFHQFEADVSRWRPDFRQGLGLEGRVSYFQIDSGSHSVYLYSNGPHLKHRRFHAFYGRYPEGRKLGETEESFAHTVRDGMKRPGAPALVILPDFVPMVFDHIGTSFQHSEFDQGGMQ